MQASLTSMKSILVGIFIASFAILAGTLSANAQASTITKTVNGNDYEITTISGAYSNASIAAQLEATPWWGDSSLSFDISTAVLHELGDSGLNPIASALAAYATNAGSVSITWTLTGTSTVNDCPVSCPALSDVHNYLVGTLLASSKFAPVKYTSAPDFIPSNVPTCSGSEFVSGFQIVGGGKISWYVDHRHAGKCFNVDVTVLPEGVSSWDVEAVLEMLGGNYDVYRRG